ncbi:MAG: Fic family protein [Bacteroidales bacterium]|nr:Fic family protein [Bacteroidales bacterium]
MKNFKSGYYVDQGYYKSFQPESLNHQMQIDDMELLVLLSEADRLVGKLDMFSKYVPNIDLFISMHVAKEATLSSRIEGTRTNIDETLLERNDLPMEQQNDWEEVQNYIKAINWSVLELEKLPFSSRLIRETHKILLQGVRGQTKQPGEFRKSQNWIGGANIQTAIFVPPVHTSVPELMGDLEKYLYNEKFYFPELLKIGIAHYQFETIHPFLDGNGRIGRLMIPLYLVNKGILTQPILYLSDFLEKNRMSYYERLNSVRKDNDIGRWLKFFLIGVIETVKLGIATFNNILQLQIKIEKNIQTLGSRANNAKILVDYLYDKPIIDAEKVHKLLNISMPSAYKLISDFEKLDILREITGSQRGRKYIFENYVQLFR